MVDDKGPQTAVEERESQPEGDQGQQPIAEKNPASLAVRSGKTEAQAPVAGIEGAEAEGTDHQPGHRQGEAADRHAVSQRPHRLGQRQAHQRSQCNAAPLEDGPGFAVVGKGGTGQLQIAVEILLAADLGPGRVKAEGDDAEQQIDDPDAEIFTATAGELQALPVSRNSRSRRDGGRLRRCRRRAGDGREQPGIVGRPPAGVGQGGKGLAQLHQAFAVIRLRRGQPFAEGFKPGKIGGPDRLGIGLRGNSQYFVVIECGSRHRHKSG